MTKPVNLTNDLCLRCGLCCDGTLFRAVELQSDDDSTRLKNLGLKIRGARRPSPDAASVGLQFAQPCSALGAGCRCQIYSERPSYCRQFECLLFQHVREKKQTVAEALRLIRSARRRVATVRRLLWQLGDHDTHQPLALRFRRIRRRMESGDSLAPSSESVTDEAAHNLFQQLSLAVHRLNLLLGERFYPDPG